MLAAITTGPALAAGAPAPSPTVTEWTHLRYEARKALVLSGSVAIERRHAPAPPVPPLPDECMVQGTAAQPLGTVSVLDSTTRAGGLSQAETWIADADGSVFLVEEKKPGRRWKRQRYGAASACEERAKPAKGDREKKLEASAWSARSNRSVAAPVGLRPATDAFGLLELASRLALSPAVETEAWTVSRGKGVLVHLTKGGSATLDRDVEVAWDGDAPGHQAAPALGPVIRILVTGEQGQDDDEEASVALLGLRGPVEVLVETAHGLPVEVRGRVPRLGLVRVRLVSARVARRGAGADGVQAGPEGGGYEAGRPETTTTSAPSPVATGAPPGAR